ncbi:succinylglutamate desuccinylase/aspartoacylase family protein [Photobacterium minamisatsumaniensis]|uniref:succinylglutamate desuccinylase/aspartoacylase family protein n=1 Tax=Photobacterium minamisatsumaniensis TaxID=2910233 RepID=UPI003D0A2C12
MKTTVYTDDILQGHQVISQLNVDELPTGCHRFWFRPQANGIGQSWHLPVVVYRGEQGDGSRKVMITAGVHGDELNGVITAQKIIQVLAEKTVHGTVVIVPTVNVSGMLMHTRDFILSDPDASPTNLNRIFPGKPDGDAAQRYIAAIWHDLLGHNADLAIDLHTQTRGAEYPLYVFADYRIPQAVKMARLMNPDCIFDDPGDDGVLETVWNRSGVPSITVEVGAGKVLQPDMIERSLNGVMNILSAEGLVDADIQLPEFECFEGKEVFTIRATLGGFALPQVSIGKVVEIGQLVAIQYDSFGDEIQRYHAPTSGYVLSVNQDPMREPGTLLVRLLK